MLVFIQIGPNAELSLSWREITFSAFRWIFLPGTEKDSGIGAQLTFLCHSDDWLSNDSIFPFLLFYENEVFLAHFADINWQWHSALLEK